MSVQYTAFTAIGIFVPVSDLVTEYEEPSCRHSDEDRKGKHCIECGVRVSMVEKEGTKLLDDLDTVLANNGLTGFPIYEGDYELQGWVIGYWLHSREEAVEYALMPDISEIENNIKGFLSEYKIDVPTKVKLISHLHCSF